MTLGAYLVLNVFVGPITEELCFRGHLLPRMGQLGRWAPLVNVFLFSLYSASSDGAQPACRSARDFRR
jgi:uncharacterized protein